MAVKIRLKRFGKKRQPFYRIVVMDSRNKRDGRAIEEIGKYHPTEEPSFIEVNSERAQYWLSVGAQPTEQVTALLKLSGDWQAFKGEKGANTIKPVARKASPEDQIKALADAAEKLKAEKAAAKEKAAKEAEEAAKAAAAAAEETVADESSEVPADEGTEVDVEIAEGNPSDTDDKVEGLADEAEEN